ncbi:ER membrane protein complex subunit 3 [Monosporozyma unispora]|nr:ER membrane complex subunit 3 [Kazachstania unispora]
MKLLEVLANKGSYSVAELMLDSDFKKWVLLPISIMMILTGLLKSDLMLLISPKYTGYPRVKLSEMQWFVKGQLLLGNGTNLDDESYDVRRHELIEILTSGKYVAQEKKEPNAEKISNPLADPSINESLMNMAKGNMANFIPQTIIMWWVNYFFGGFVIMKLPFPLTVKFKDMLQNGIMTSDLDARWVSAISWYFISVLGMNPLYNLLNSNPEEGQVNNQMNQVLGGTGQPAPDVIMKNLANDLTIATQHESCFDDIESRVLKMYE